MESKPEPQTLIIAVNYNSNDHACSFAKCVLRQSGVPCKLIIVDNSDTEEPSLSSLLDTEIKSGTLSILSPGKNLGYFGGASQALEQHLSHSALPDWVIVCNVDISIEELFLSRLVDQRSHAGVGVIAPSIVSLVTGRDQNPHLVNRPTSLRMHFYKWVYKSLVTAYLYQAAHLLKTLLLRFFMILIRGTRPFGHLEGTPQAIYAPQGSIMIFTKEYFQSGGNLRHGVFLFGEEVFVAETCRRLGLTVVYQPNLRVEHHEHVSTGLFRSRRMLNFFSQAASYCADEFFS